MCDHFKEANKAAKKIASGLKPKQRRKEIAKWVEHMKEALKGKI